MLKYNAKLLMSSGNKNLTATYHNEVQSYRKARFKDTEAQSWLKYKSTVTQL